MENQTFKFARHKNGCKISENVTFQWRKPSSINWPKIALSGSSLFLSLDSTEDYALNSSVSVVCFFNVKILCSKLICLDKKAINMLWLHSTFSHCWIISTLAHPTAQVRTICLVDVGLRNLFGKWHRNYIT